jgi:hypothetical protein
MRRGNIKFTLRRSPLGRPGRKWEDNTKTDVKGMGWNGGGQNLAKDRDKWWVRFLEIREISRIAYEKSALKKDYAQRKSE